MVELFGELLAYAPWWAVLLVAVIGVVVWNVPSIPYGLGRFGSFLIEAVCLFAAVRKLVRWRDALREREGGQSKQRQTGASALLGGAPITLPPFTPLPDFYAMSWDDFERFIGDVYRSQGYAVTLTGGRRAPDGGIDLVASRGGERTVVQCKRWQSRAVGVQIVREIAGVRLRERAHRAACVTSGYFSPEARAEAPLLGVDLIDGYQLRRWAQETARRQAAFPAPPIATPDPRALAHDAPAEVGVSEPWLGAPPPEAVQVGTVEAPTCPACGAPMLLRRARRGDRAGSEFWGCSRYPQCRGAYNTYAEPDKPTSAT